MRRAELTVRPCNACHRLLSPGGTNVRISSDVFVLGHMAALPCPGLRSIVLCVLCAADRIKVIKSTFCGQGVPAICAIHTAGRQSGGSEDSSEGGASGGGDTKEVRTPYLDLCAAGSALVVCHEVSSPARTCGRPSACGWRRAGWSLCEDLHCGSPLHAKQHESMLPVATARDHVQRHFSST